MVIFGGMLRDVYPAALAQVRIRIASNVLPVARERVRLRTSGLGDDATIVGAAELGFASLLADPQRLLTHVMPARAHARRQGAGE